MHGRASKVGENMSFWAISKRRIKGPVGICGLIATNTQKRPLSEANLTAERALEISQAMETVEKGAIDFKEEHQDSKRQETETAAINVVRKPGLGLKNFGVASLCTLIVAFKSFIFPNCCLNMTSYLYKSSSNAGVDFYPIEHVPPGVRKGALVVLGMGIIHGIALIVGLSVTSANVLDIWHGHAGQAVQKRRLRIE